MSDEASSPPVPLLRAHDIGYQHDGRALLDEVSFELLSGQATAIHADNAASVGVLFDLLRGASAPTSGRVEVAGKPLRRRAGEPHLVMRCAACSRAPSHLPAGVALVLAAQPLSGQWWHALRNKEQRRTGLRLRAHRALHRTGLASYATRPLRDLAPAQRVAFAVAEALLSEPSVLLLDRPFRGLDGAARAYLIGLLRALLAERLALLVYDDDSQALQGMCQNWLVLANGKKLAQGTMDRPGLSQALLTAHGIDDPSLRAEEPEAVLALIGADY